MIMEIRDIRKTLNFTQKQFSDYYGIPVRTIQHWENRDRKTPNYVKNIITENLRLKGLLKDEDNK